MKVRERRDDTADAGDDAREVFAPLGVDRMSGAEFEALVAELLELTGFDVERVGGSGDLGADLVAEDGGTRFTVQAKRVSPDRTVSRRAVSDAVAARSHYDCGDAMVVTTATFSPDVREFAARRCLLIGRPLLAGWVSKHRDELLDRLDVEELDRLGGRDFEGLVAEILRDRGHSVERVGGSGDFGADLIADRGGDRTAVQVKRHSRPVSRRAVSDAVAAVDHYDCDAAMVVTSAPGFSSGARTLAESAGCELVARPTLAEWISGLSGPGEAGDADGPYADAGELLDYLRWREGVLDASVDDLVLDLPGSQFGLLASAFFLRRIGAEATIRYSGMPGGTWLVMKVPRHPKVEWSVEHREARRSGEVFWLPLEGTGTFRLDVEISFSGGVTDGLEEAQRTVREWASDFPAQFTWGEPDDEAVEALRGTSAGGS